MFKKMSVWIRTVQGLCVSCFFRSRTCANVVFVSVNRCHQMFEEEEKKTQSRRRAGLSQQHEHNNGTKPTTLCTATQCSHAFCGGARPDPAEVQPCTVSLRHIHPRLGRGARSSALHFGIIGSSVKIQFLFCCSSKPLKFSSPSRRQKKRSAQHSCVCVQQAKLSL